MNLKNLLIMAAMSMMAFGFAACSSDDDDDKDGMLYDDVNSEYNDYVSVCGIKWARGNLQHLGEDWRIADHSGNTLIMSMVIPGRLFHKVLRKWIISIGEYAVQML